MTPHSPCPGCTRTDYLNIIMREPDLRYRIACECDWEGPRSDSVEGAWGLWDAQGPSRLQERAARLETLLSRANPIGWAMGGMVEEAKRWEAEVCAELGICQEGNKP